MVAILALGLCTSPLAVAQSVPGPQANAAENGTAIAADGDVHYTVNDLKKIRRALRPELQRALARILITEKAQLDLLRQLLSEVGAENRRLHEKTQADIQRRFDALERKLEAPSSRTLDTQLERWIERAQDLQMALEGPDKAAARAWLKQGNFDAALQALSTLREKQLLAAQQAQLKADELRNAASQRQLDIADTDFQLGQLATLKFDYAAAAEHHLHAALSYRKLHEQGLGNTAVQAKGASALLGLGHAYSELGRPEDALRAAQDAVTIHRSLYASSPHAFLADLAASLNDVGLRQKDLGRPEDAQKALEEAVGLRRELVKLEPDVYRAALAMSLTNLGTVYDDLGQRHDALKSALEAVGLYRALARERPGSFLWELGASVVNLGTAHRMETLAQKRGVLIVGCAACSPVSGVAWA